MSSGWRRFIPLLRDQPDTRAPEGHHHWERHDEIMGDSSSSHDTQNVYGRYSPLDANLHDSSGSQVFTADSVAARGATPSRSMISGHQSPNAQGMREVSSEGGSLRGYTTLCRLARFGANLADAHSCFLFFHGALVSALDPGIVPPGGMNQMVLAGFHSLSPEILPHCVVSADSGLIGWVASHRRSIHVSPFELDSRTLGIYSADQQLKSFIGIPILLQDPYEMLGAAGVASGQLTGVLACDSKKSFAFSKLQGKLLEDLSREIAETVELLVEQQGRAHPDVAWHLFLRRASELARSVRMSSIEVVRIVTTNFRALERRNGTSAALTASEQLHRIIRQILPPHFPSVRLINGDVLIVLDNMMTSFYESRIKAVNTHNQTRQSPHAESLQFDFIRASSRDKRRKDLTIEELVQMTSIEDTEREAPRQAGTLTLAPQSGAPLGSSSHQQPRGGIVRLEKAVGYGNSRS